MSRVRPGPRILHHLRAGLTPQSPIRFLRVDSDHRVIIKSNHSRGLSRGTGSKSESESRRTLIIRRVIIESNSDHSSESNSFQSPRVDSDHQHCVRNKENIRGPTSRPLIRSSQIMFHVTSQAGPTDSSSSEGRTHSSKSNSIPPGRL